MGFARKAKSNEIIPPASWNYPKNEVPVEKRDSKDQKSLEITTKKRSLNAPPTPRTEGQNLDYNNQCRDKEMHERINYHYGMEDYSPSQTVHSENDSTLVGSSNDDRPWG